MKLKVKLHTLNNGSIQTCLGAYALMRNPFFPPVLLPNQEDAARRTVEAEMERFR
jgi:hypothetical protein